MAHPDVEEDLRFQRKLWKVEHAAWWTQLAVVVAALLGLLGKGPLSGGTLQREGATIAFERLARRESRGELSLEVAPALLRDGELRLCADRRWLSGVDLERMVPEPRRGEAGEEATCFTFEVAGDGAARVRLQLAYRAAGRRQGRLTVSGGPSLTFTQWVYP
jgi:hypothetical protein